MSQYVVALRREQRGTAPADWFKPLLRFKRLKIVSPVTGRRIIVEGDDRTVERVRKVMSPICHIEEAIQHQRR